MFPNRCRRSAESLFLACVVASALPAEAQVAQAGVGAGVASGPAGAAVGAGVTASPAGVSAGATVTAGVAPAPTGVATGASIAAGTQQSDRLDRDTLIRRGVAIGAIGVTGSYAARKVSGVAKGMVDFGKVKGVPHWGPAVAAVPHFGSSAAKGSVIPTTLGQVPVMGSIVKSVPLVGPVIAGPADPIVVGAVAVDNYVIPKYSPCGYTKSSVIAATNDFNSPPKLRHYVNYLAPLPYSHPPIYSPSTLKTDLPADMAYIDAVPPRITDTVSVPEFY